METRGNYVLVGLLAIAVLATSFAYFYWSGRYQANRNQLPVELEVRGSAVGIGPGSAVLFNGLYAGDVSAIVSDRVDPNLVLIFAQINKDLPIKTDTKASIGSQGITGVSVVNLDGGSIDAPKLVDPNATIVPVLSAKATADLVTQAQGLSSQADDILAEINSFLRANRENIDATINNIRGFSNALNSNSDELEDLLKSAGNVGRSLSSVAQTIQPVASQLEQVLASVEPKKIENIAGNIEKFTQDIVGASTRVNQILQQTEQTSLSLAQFSTNLIDMVQQAQILVSAIDPNQVQSLVSTVGDAGRSIAQIGRDLEPIAKAVSEGAGDVSTILKDAAQISANISQGTQNLPQLTESVTKASDKIAGLTDSADRTFGQIERVLEAIQPEDLASAIISIKTAAASAEKTIQNFEPLGNAVAKRSENFDSMIGDLQATLANIRGASTRISGLFDTVDGLLQSNETQGLVFEAKQAAASFKRLGLLLETRTDSITSNINTFSDRGLRDLQQLIVQMNQAVRSFDRLAKSLEADPQKVIFGGDDVKEFGGRQRR